jgi:hypothetical protein
MLIVNNFIPVVHVKTVHAALVEVPILAEFLVYATTVNNLKSDVPQILDVNQVKAV